MRHALARSGARAQPLAVIVLLLAGCAGAPDVQTVLVKAPLAPAPAACAASAKPIPPLPDRAITTAELAVNYNRLKALYLREVGRGALCRKHVARLYAAK